MAKISSTIELQDRMSLVLNKINNSLNVMNLTMNNVNDNVSHGFDDNQVNDFNSAIETASASVQELSDIVKNIDGGVFGTLTKGAITMASATGTVIGNIVSKVGGGVLDVITSMINKSIDLYKSEENAQMQLAATLKNTSDDAASSYDRILDKAQKVSDSGMYDKGSMVAAGAEFATYFSDNDAIDTMMDTLTNYAAGMSGGGAIDNKQMVDYATNIAKLTTGAYDAMTKKGFEVTDVQKSILKGEKLSAEGVVELQRAYEMLPEEMQLKLDSNVSEWTEDMQKAAVINSIIAESWDGMYEAMSDTPEGKLLSLTNQVQDLMVVAGGELLESFNRVYDVVRNNWETIRMVINGVVDVIRVVISVIAIALDFVLKGIQMIYDFFQKHGEMILNTVIDVIGTIIGIFNVVKTFFTNLIADLKTIFWGLLETVMNIVTKIAEVLNKLPFVEIDVEGLANKAEEYGKEKENAWNSRVSYGDAYNNGKQWVNDLANNLGNFISDATAPLTNEHSYFGDTQREIANNTEATANALEKNSEELEYLKDFAEQETINRFTTAEIKVDMGGISQNISKDTDADGVVDYLVGALEKSMSAVAEGVY